METTCSYTDEWAWFSSDERRWHNRIRKYAERYPGEVEILRRPEDNDGCIYAKLPASWFKIQRPAQVVMTDEEKLARVARLRKTGHNAQEAGIGGEKGT